MRRPQHFIFPFPLEEGPFSLKDKKIVHQMERVLRMKAGDCFIALDGEGRRAKGFLRELSSKKGEGDLSELEIFSRPAQELFLYMAVPKKPAVFEVIVQKATELGVTTIYPLITARSQVTQLKNTQRLNLILKEATEQSERVFLPELKFPLKWKEFIHNPPPGLILAGDPWDFDAELKEISSKDASRLNLIIGPEGGLTSGELQDIRNLGGIIFVLGKEVLRMETAAFAALAILHYGK